MKISVWESTPALGTFRGLPAPGTAVPGGREQGIAALGGAARLPVSNKCDFADCNQGYQRGQSSRGTPQPALQMRGGSRFVVKASSQERVEGSGGRGSGTGVAAEVPAEAVSGRAGWEGHPRWPAGSLSSGGVNLK